jgi:hypothetical protein
MTSLTLVSAHTFGTAAEIQPADNQFSYTTDYGWLKEKG